MAGELKDLQIDRGKRRSAGVKHDHAVLYGAFETHCKTPYFMGATLAVVATVLYYTQEHL